MEKCKVEIFIKDFFILPNVTLLVSWGAYESHQSSAFLASSSKLRLIEPTSCEDVVENYQPKLHVQPDPNPNR